MPTCKRFDGTNNVDPTFVRRWDGSANVDVSFVRRFDGVNWELVWPLTDLTPDTIVVPDQYAGYTAVNGMSSMPNYVTTGNFVISGISAAIVLQFVCTASVWSGGGFVYVRKNGGSWQTVATANVGQAVVNNNLTMSLSNGDNISFRFGINGPSASPLNPYTSAEWHCNVNMRNTSSGNASVGSFNCSGYMTDQWGDDDGGGIIMP